MEVTWVQEEGEESLSDGERSTDSLDVNVIVGRVSEALEDNELVYICRSTTGAKVEVDRSDMMDGGKHQRLILDFERRFPPPWDETCSYCEGAGCEECICDECDRPMRHICGVNYGCVRHPVV